MKKIAKQDAQQYLADVPEQHIFYCCDGRTIRNLTELQSTLETMSDDTFIYHSDHLKSDFSNWVHEIIKEGKLAEELRTAGTNRIQALDAVRQRIAVLQKAAAVAKGTKQKR